MVELHLHLDGSLTPQTVKKISEEEGVRLSEYGEGTVAPGKNENGNISETGTVCVQVEKRLAEWMRYQSENGSLADYLKCFDLPIKVLQTPNAVRYACMKLCEELVRDGVDYAEIRFAPQFHTQKGFTQEEILLGAIEAKDYASLLGVEIDLILCAMRGQNSRANEETLELAVKYFGKGVAALDLAGDEAGFPTEDYADLFGYAKKCGLPFTIHAGEAAGAESIEAALRFGAWRIGHGVAAVSDPELMKYLSVHQIPLELCPTSNIQTKAVREIASHPLVRFLEQGIPATVNTDNRTVSGTTMKREFQVIKKIPGYVSDYERLLKANAERSRFTELIKAKR